MFSLGAFQDENQYSELIKLSNQGHGLYPRLFYQLDLLTKIVKVNYKALLINNQANNGNITDPGSEFSTKALNCQDILNILEEQSYGHQTGKCLIFNFFIFDCYFLFFILSFVIFFREFDM